MPEGAQRVECEPAPGGLLDILWGAVDALGRVEGAAYFVEVGTEREAESGDGV